MSQILSNSLLSPKTLGPEQESRGKTAPKPTPQAIDTTVDTVFQKQVKLSIGSPSALSDREQTDIEFSLRSASPSSHLSLAASSEDDESLLDGDSADFEEMLESDNSEFENDSPKGSSARRVAFSIPYAGSLLPTDADNKPVTNAPLKGLPVKRGSFSLPNTGSLLPSDHILVPTSSLKKVDPASLPWFDLEDEEPEQVSSIPELSLEDDELFNGATPEFIDASDSSSTISNPETAAKTVFEASSQNSKKTLPPSYEPFLMFEKSKKHFVKTFERVQKTRAQNFYMSSTLFLALQIKRMERRYKSSKDTPELPLADLTTDAVNARTQIKNYVTCSLPLLERTQKQKEAALASKKPTALSKFFPSLKTLLTPEQDTSVSSKISYSNPLSLTDQDQSQSFIIEKASPDFQKEYKLAVDCYTAFQNSCTDPSLRREVTEQLDRVQSQAHDEQCTSVTFSPVFAKAAIMVDTSSPTWQEECTLIEKFHSDYYDLLTMHAKFITDRIDWQTKKKDL